MTEKKIIGQAESLCPVCLKNISAQKVYRDGGIYLEKSCAEHGFFSVLVWAGDPASYAAWDRKNERRDELIDPLPVDEGCPRDCGLCADHLRKTCCVLLEVTQRCNLKCPICFAAAGEDTSADLSLTEIRRRYQRLMDSGGPYNIQLSGGEPTLRDDLPEIIRIGREEGFTFFQLNTNGLRLADDANYLQGLIDAGLSCVYLQFDGLRAETYRRIRGRDILAEKLQAIDNCRRLGIGVVLVPTVVPGINDDEVGDIIAFAAERLPLIRGVHFQPASRFGRFEVDVDREPLTIPSFLQAIERQTAGRYKAADFIAGGAENSYCSFHGNFLVDGEAVQPLSTAGTGCCSTSSDTSRESVARQWTLSQDAVKDEVSSCCVDKESVTSVGSPSTEVTSSCCGESAEELSSCCDDKAIVASTGCGEPVQEISSCCEQEATVISVSSNSVEAKESCCDDAIAVTSASCPSDEVISPCYGESLNEASSCCSSSTAKLYTADSLDAFLHEREQKTLAISGMFFQDAMNVELDRLRSCYICEVTEGGVIPFCAYNLTDSTGRALYRGKEGFG